MTEKNFIEFVIASASPPHYRAPSRSGYYKVKYNLTNDYHVTLNSSTHPVWEDGFYRYDISYYDSETDTWYNDYDTFLDLTRYETDNQCRTQDMVKYINAIGFYNEIDFDITNPIDYWVEV